MAPTPFPDRAPAGHGRLPAALLALLLAAGCGGAAGDDAATGSSPDGSAATTAFRGALLLDGRGGAPVEDAVLVVEGDRIVAVGSADQVTVPEGATTVDLSGRTVMPALVNTHAHLASERDARIRELRHHAYYGAGAVTSLGMDEGEAPFALRDEPVPGAALGLTAGRGITRPEPGRSEIPFWIDTAEEGREAVRTLAEDGVDLVKIWVDDRGGQYEKLTPELFGAVIDEAHAHGLRVTAHIFSLEDAKALVRAGVDAFAHGVRDQAVDDELVELLAARPDFVYVPNLPGSGIDTDLGWLAGTVPEAELEELRGRPAPGPGAQESFRIQADNLARLHGAGVMIGFGTDGSSPWAAHLEMEDMVAAGMAPGDVLAAATGSSARLLGLDDRGTLEAGKRADFLVLEANPLDDITHTRRIQAVYLGGQALDRETLASELRTGAGQ